jgi:glutamine amidotransferase
MIHIIDCKIGNIGSVANMLQHIGAEVVIATTPAEIANASKIILPGVGAFDAGVFALHQSGFDVAIKNRVQNSEAMILGICLGMQLLMEQSEEGLSYGLGLVPGEVKKIVIETEKMRVPHMGWNTVDVIRNNRLLGMMPDEDRRFYFVHSYCVSCKDELDSVGSTLYGSPFTSMIERDRIMGVQFHPEKSHRYGKELLKNFLVAQ